MAFTPGDLAAWLQLLPLVLPLIDAIVTWIEKLFGGGNGPKKAEAALKIARAVIPPLPSGEQVSDSVLKTMINNAVSLNNQAGVFDHLKPGTVDPQPCSIYQP